MDTTITDIFFDEKGECKYCKIHDEMESIHPLNKSNSNNIDTIVLKIKKAGVGKKYDCVCGISGGRDSSYTLLKAVEYGLRPLAVTVDNGWGTEIAARNIKNACEKLNVDLIRVTFDWDEYKDIQRAFFFAGVPDVDSPSDLAIYTQLFKTAKEYNIKYTLNGHSFRTEGSSPISWSYFDPVYIKDVYKKYGHKKLKTIPLMSYRNLIVYTFVNRIKEVRLLEYVDYRKKEVDEILKNKIQWEDYGGHHHENIFTYFLQSYYFPVKFNIDKRKTELSAQIRSGHMTREYALDQLKTPYGYKQEVVDYVINRLDFSKDEFNDIMQSKNRSHNEYRTLLPIYKLLKFSINLTTKMKLLPRIFYLKYCK
jgi:N-acetyl sugar amidotransferase